MFIIDLTYQGSLESIDALMKEHMAFIRKGYAENLFIASGRKIPRTGGIILARGKTKKEFEELMGHDPFISKGLAAFTITEFQTSQSHPDLKRLLES